MIKTLKVLINIRFKYTVVISIIHFIWFAQKTQPIYFTIYSNTRYLSLNRNKLKNLYLFLQEDSIQNIPLTDRLYNPLDN